MAKIIILGAGLVGSVMAKDLAKDHEVCSVDLNKKALQPLIKEGIKTLHVIVFCYSIRNRSLIADIKSAIVNLKTC